MKKRDRLDWLDIAKGITIILMMLGHTSIPKPVNSFIFAFHMPLFFIASGWSTSWEKYSFGKFFQRKVKTLLLPFVIYSIMVIAIAWWIGYDVINYRQVIAKGWQGYALWFIPVLFLALMVSKLVMSIPHKWMRYALAFFLVLIGAILKYQKVSSPWTLCTVPYAAFLILLGVWLKRFHFIADEPKWWLVLLFSLITLIVSQNWRMDLAWNQILPVTLLTIAAITGTIMVFSISWYIDHFFLWLPMVLRTIGKETFVILSFSQILGFLVVYIYPCNKIVEYLFVFTILFVISVVKNLIKSSINIIR